MVREGESNKATMRDENERKKE